MLSPAPNPQIQSDVAAYSVSSGRLQSPVGTAAFPCHPGKHLRLDREMNPTFGKCREKKREIKGLKVLQKCSLPKAAGMADGRMQQPTSPRAAGSTGKQHLPLSGHQDLRTLWICFTPANPNITQGKRLCTALRLVKT